MGINNKMVSIRSILKSSIANEQAEGVGARVRRSIGTMNMRNFTPFLMLDHFNVSPTAGFPDHPHRNVSTVTMIMKNYIIHEDFTGASGVLRPGDLQFMTAGKGIVHSEMPYSEDGTNVEGMQLWVGLPEENSYCDPEYRDLRAEEIPIVRPNDKVEVKVISGEAYGVQSVKTLAHVPIDYYWYTIQPGGEFQQEIPADYNAFLYILNGSLKINGRTFKQYNNIFFNRDGANIEGMVPSDSEKTDFVLIAGKVLDQNIVQYGPFVDTTKEGIYKAIQDYQSGTNGFENARNWKSDTGSGITPALFRTKSHELLTDQGIPLEASERKIITPKISKDEL